MSARGRGRERARRPRREGTSGGEVGGVSRYAAGTRRGGPEVHRGGGTRDAKRGTNGGPSAAGGSPDRGCGVPAGGTGGEGACTGRGCARGRERVPGEGLGGAVRGGTNGTGGTSGGNEGRQAGNERGGLQPRAVLRIGGVVYRPGGPAGREPVPAEGVRGVGSEYRVRVWEGRSGGERTGPEERRGWGLLFPVARFVFPDFAPPLFPAFHAHRTRS